jgi:hypothetical protein
MVQGDWRVLGAVGGGYKSFGGGSEEGQGDVSRVFFIFFPSLVVSFIFTSFHRMFISS